MPSLLVYGPVVTARLRYILDFLFNGSYNITDSLEDFKYYSGAKICYTKEKLNIDCYWIEATELLFENNIQQQNIIITYWQDLPIFFSGKGDLPFDILAASFYFITRYEEYLPHDKDQYGRYAETNGLAFREQFLHLPLVDLWLQELNKILKKRYADYNPVKTKYRYRPTFDIDIPFAFLHKPLYIQAGAFLKNILHRKTETLRQQVATWRGKMQDPFDTFTYLNTQMQQYGWQPTFFFPVAKKHGAFDKNPAQSNTAFQRLIQQEAELFNIGIHPSWQSGDDNTLLRQEKQYLETISNKKITKSRQHYLRMTIPETYDKLIALGIQEDFTMGYGNANGFRASTSRPFYWFDLRKNEKTELRIHPFCWMDATAYHHQKDSAEKVLADLNYFSQVIHNVGGQMITVMHNNYHAAIYPYTAYRKSMATFWSENR
ncbi:MAG: hypothetical protein QM610_07500 [Chitinophagaceae bacterium]